MSWYDELDKEYDDMVTLRKVIKKREAEIELLDKHINDLTALLDTVERDWESEIIQSDPIWFATLINKTRALKNDYENQRAQMVG
jgi:hypothetical protein